MLVLCFTSLNHKNNSAITSLNFNQFNTAINSIKIRVKAVLYVVIHQYYCPALTLNINTKTVYESINIYKKIPCFFMGLKISSNKLCMTR